MATVPQVIAQIRFAIEEQLSARNAHHEFEHMCRHFARLRICSNILPATGPVSAGGDQGRDFETFRTYIHKSPLTCSSFVGSASEGLVVFGCSLQKDNITRKIKKDIKLIMEPGQCVSSIHMFFACDISTGRRHELQAWAHTHHHVHLELYDSQALSELLCDVEIFWIAEHFLSIPREFRPHLDEEEGDSWYNSAVERWTHCDDFLTNPANFYELVSAVRHATFTDRAKSDLPLWISCLRAFQEDEGCPEELYWGATYEIAVASLRGLGSIEGLEQDLRRYFLRIDRLELATDLEDAGVLILYCCGAYQQNAVQLTLAEIRVAGDSIQRRLREQIFVTQSPTTKCMYLESLGYNLIVFQGAMHGASYPDLNETTSLWSEMLDLVVDAPLYPLERFADRVTEIIRLLGDASQLEDITNRLDALLAERHGGFKAAEKCRDRSMALRERDQMLRAITELHRAKIAWFADETLGGSILTMMMLSMWYLELGLTYAAKQYAMAAAYISMQTTKKELKRHAPSALMLVAECEYAQGCWCDFLGLANTALLAYHLVPNQEQNPETIDSQMEEISYHAGIALMVAERFTPTILPRMQELVADWPFADMVDEAFTAARKVWSKKSDAAVWDDLQGQILGKPFGDVGATRTVIWKQLGLTWTVSWDNTYSATALAEQFMSTAQVLMAEWAGLDLCILRSQITVEVRTRSKTNSKIESKTSNKRRLWLINFSMQRENIELEEVQKEAFGFVTAIIREVSLLSDSEFFELMSNSLKKGVVSKIQIARPYEDLYRNCILDSRPFDEERFSWTTPQAPMSFRVTEHKSMAWFEGPGPGYSKSSSAEHIRNRYHNVSVSIKFTLARLSACPAFLDIVRNLRREGWLDWHMLVAIANITWNYRASQLETPVSDALQKLRESVSDAMVRQESENTTPVPMSEYTEESMRRSLKLSQVATLRTLRLECHQQTPDFEAIDDFLRERFNYWTDDVEHEDPFPDG